MAEDIAEKMRTEAYLLRDQLRIIAVVNSVRKVLIEGAEEIDQLRAVLRIIWIAYQDNDGIRKIFLEAGLRHDRS